MPTHSRAQVLLVMLAAVIALAVGETLLARGMRQVGHAPRSLVTQGLAILGNGWVWAGAVGLVLHVGLYMAAMRDADLSYILPLTAASYPLAALLAKLVLNEAVSPLRWGGIALITIGVALISLGDAPSR